MIPSPLLAVQRVPHELRRLGENWENWLSAATDMTIISYWPVRVGAITPSSIVNTCKTHLIPPTYTKKHRDEHRKNSSRCSATGTGLPSGTPHMASVWNRFSRYGRYGRYTANSQSPLVIHRYRVHTTVSRLLG